MERARMIDNAQLLREKQMADLKKANLDDNMLKLQALETAESVF